LGFGCVAISLTNARPPALAAVIAAADAGSGFPLSARG
jgi:hypothetical protein